VTRLCLILAASLAALAAPALARGGGVELHAHRFDMVAFRWQGAGTVTFRVHRARGGWTGWQAADDDPTWTGAADRWQVRRHGAVRGLHAATIWSPVGAAPHATRSLADGSQPAIVLRKEWQANEEIVRGHPTYAPRIELAVIHHTANTNAYTPAQAAAIVRGIEAYHVQGNGWNDIGYNFLVDRFGNVYEGRAGGIDRNVVGAHAEGFNSGTVGIALIGNFTTATPPKAMQDAVVKLLAWRLDVAHVDPLSTAVYTSGGNAKFKAGKVVTLRAISGHRDTGSSECPGNAAYALIGPIAKRVAATGLPKLYAPTVSGALGASVRFQARLSSKLPWTVTVLDQLGHTVAHATGTGATVDWTWRSTVAAKGAYTWTIAATGARVASGLLGVRTTTAAAAPTLTDVSATLAQLSFTLGTAAQVKAQIEGGATVLDAKRPAGPNVVAWDSSTLPVGRYRLVVTATANGKSVTKSVDLVVDTTVSGFAVAPGDAATTSFTFTLAQAATVKLEVDKGVSIVAQIYSGDLPAGAATISWDRTGFGVPLAPGSYTAVLTVADSLGAIPFSVPLTLG
jgi:hypothetical protein